jgi:hypothetical protein
VGHYLDAADSAVRSLGVSSGNEVTEEARSIYNAASQEVAVLLRSSAVDFCSSHEPNITNSLEPNFWQILTL